MHKLSVREVAHDEGRVVYEFDYQYRKSIYPVKGKIETRKIKDQPLELSCNCTNKHCRLPEWFTYDDLAKQKGLCGMLALYLREDQMGKYNLVKVPAL